MNLKSIKNAIKGVIKEKYPDIELAYVFGSYAKGEATPNSDIDIAVLFSQDDIKKIFKRYLTFMADVAQALKTDNVDVVLINDLEDPILLMEIVRFGKTVIDKNNASTNLYLKALAFYNDYQHWSKIFN